MTLRKVLCREERQVENISNSGRTMSWRVRTRWLLTLECGHQVEYSDTPGQRVQRVCCKACDAGSPPDVDPSGVPLGVVRAPPSGLGRFMEEWRAANRENPGECA